MHDISALCVHFEWLQILESIVGHYKRSSLGTPTKLGTVDTGETRKNGKMRAKNAKHILFNTLANLLHNIERKRFSYIALHISKHFNTLFRFPRSPIFPICTHSPEIYQAWLDLLPMNDALNTVCFNICNHWNITQGAHNILNLDILLG